MTSRIDNKAKLIAVSSGKGGVGKTTISACLALELIAQGKKVGLLDADFYGPSIPTFFGLQNVKAQTSGSMLQPVYYNQLELMSIAFLAEADAAFAWRGPMLGKALAQMLEQVAWSAELDYLIIDTPPGTGDVHLSLFSNYKLYGAVIVTIPSPLSFADVARCVDLHRKYNINILGVIENMSYYQPNAEEKKFPFGQGAGRQLIEKFSINSLQQVPLLASPENLQELNKGMSINLQALGI